MHDDHTKILLPDFPALCLSFICRTVNSTLLPCSDKNAPDWLEQVGCLNVRMVHHGLSQHSAPPFCCAWHDQLTQLGWSRPFKAALHGHKWRSRSPANLVTANRCEAPTHHNLAFRLDHHIRHNARSSSARQQSAQVQPQLHTTSHRRNRAKCNSPRQATYFELDPAPARFRAGE